MVPDTIELWKNGGVEAWWPWDLGALRILQREAWRRLAVDGTVADEAGVASYIRLPLRPNTVLRR